MIKKLANKTSQILPMNYSKGHAFKRSWDHILPVLSSKTTNVTETHQGEEEIST